MLSAERDKTLTHQGFEYYLGERRFCIYEKLPNRGVLCRPGICIGNAAFEMASPISMVYGILVCRGHVCNSTYIASVVAKTTSVGSDNLCG